MIGLEALRALGGAKRPADRNAPRDTDRAAAGAELPALRWSTSSSAGHGLVMVMGKGGVGKTTIAAALAVALARAGASTCT